MKLSKYCDENESLWNKEEHKKADKIIQYLHDKTGKDLFEIAKSDDIVETFNKLKVWLLEFYEKELMDAYN